MFKAAALFRRTKRKPLKDYYEDWILTLKNKLLPQLRHSMSLPSLESRLLSAAVERVHAHFLAYYKVLDLAAGDDVAQLLFPEWRNPLERPFLWLGDLHPYLFTNLLRSFLDDNEYSDADADTEAAAAGDSRCITGSGDELGRSALGLKNPPKISMARIEHIECGLRLMVPELVARARHAQAMFVERVGDDWGRCENRKRRMKENVRQAVAGAMDELMSVFMDANRLRRSVFADIISATNVYQSALFFEGLAQLLVGFRDPQLLHKFNKCRQPINC